MILVFGGTTEGRKAVEVLEQAGQPFYYSTRSGDQQVTLTHGRRLQGTMERADMEAFCQQNGIRLIVDAAHPFAEQLHTNLIRAARNVGASIIRFDRQYPPRTDDITWCKDYADAISRIGQCGIRRLLALTGVNTIGRLQALWQSKECECWFRILNREQSRRLADVSHFPEDHLVFYEDEATPDLLQALKPEAILTKESGLSGGFTEKVQAARAVGIRVFAIERPPYPPQDYAEWSSETSGEAVRIVVVNGPHGLRLKVQELLPAFFELHTGITTGTCATAAAIAALTGQQTVRVRIPDGEDIEVAVSYIGEKENTSAGFRRTATVIKQAGDDPDITNGIEIQATIEIRGNASKQATVETTGNASEPTHKKEPTDDVVEIRGGEGVGIVTLPGLGLPIGSAAINEVPQRMIRQNLTPLLPAGTSARVTITVPQGRLVGARTFNPRIGVRDGISIIGTSGIVRPFSTEAWLSSIRKEMAVGMAVSPVIVINSGARSESYLRQRYPHLPLQAFIHYGNFIGETIKTAAQLGVNRLVLGVMIGKAVKLADGHLDTHSHKVTMNTEFLLLMAREAGCSEASQNRIAAMTMARELWTLLDEDEMGRLAQVVLRHCHHQCAPLMPNGQMELLLISETGKIIAYQQEQNSISIRTK